MDAAPIRPATGADHTAVNRVVAEAFEKYVDRIGRRPAPMDTDFTAALDDSRVWVIEHDGGLHAVLVIEYHDDHVLIDTVAVHPAAQGRGHGARLLRRAESRARELGLAEVRLYTNEAMSENLAYYPRQGYQETARRTENGYRRVYFRKQISPAPFKI
ncbi:N-acetyltransferase GCN5 [Mycolicibacterium canariasense]|uniref:N-acetyltransferase GCN5 n=1 Tax=Mycolicibacterium canariasense TaxID=228230 RepID=A0A100WDM4_MYCCR|nr:GNAT family N-acetyltransferase [Mycolicibacterium canariasense]MCV7207954.1 GNAT family N-acetyltransferase [Mycolicibacterium canariasense]ORV04985.1 GNAT family acetyltransferase [Mycolicibacterium canariasense]GAS95978.1 N-acetyltransferase GCN5 [Mycolicibacterium canariasense]